jgi:transcriptional regulator EpsA
MRVVTEAGRIRRHADLYRWLGGDVQQLLPHEIMLSAWGDFSAWNLKLDLVSGLPGVRTAALGQCSLNAQVREAYERWLDGARNPLVLSMADMAAAQDTCQCALHGALQGMRSVLVHGVQDRRAEHESLFLAFSPGSFSKARNLEALFAQIDQAFRRVPALPLREPRLCSGHASVLELSAREIEVVEAMCRGRTNLEIAATLSISPFTVKNHVQRIFRKIGVNNRTQAAARYAEALLHSAVSSVARAQEALKEAG